MSIMNPPSEHAGNLKPKYALRPASWKHVPPIAIAGAMCNVSRFTHVCKIRDARHLVIDTENHIDRVSCFLLSQRMPLLLIVGKSDYGEHTILQLMREARASPYIRPVSLGIACDYKIGHIESCTGVFDFACVAEGSAVLAALTTQAKIAVCADPLGSPEAVLAKFIGRPAFQSIKLGK